MVRNDQTLIIVKPDGMAKGLVGPILRLLEQHNLRITDTLQLQLPLHWVERLYYDERNEIYYPEVVAWMTIAPVLLLYVEGNRAVEVVKWQIIGRYPQGIRGQYAENWIQNVAHVPDCPQAAQRELELTRELFVRRITMDQQRLEGKTVFALTGMSECGKSEAGRYFDTNGVKRLKIGQIFSLVRDKLSPGQDLYKFMQEQEEQNPIVLWDAFIDQLLNCMKKNGTDMASIESLYGGGLGPHLKRRLGPHFCMVFIDISLEIRLQRQMIREGLSNVEEAKAMLSPRDQVKTDSGIPALQEVADVVVDNSGTLDDLHRELDNLIQSHRT